ncbi:hypothetical protein [Rhizobium sp.]|uniref:hypothetical protein n=1 Tax=Rhizobium sp. TaxID=391 RepID=UPI00289FBF0D
MARQINAEGEKLIKLRPAGARITKYIRYGSSIVLPTIAAGAEQTATITATGVQVGDHMIFNPQKLFLPIWQ